MARGLDYYTGPIFEAVLTGLSAFHMPLVSASTPKIHLTIHVRKFNPTAFQVTLMKVRCLLLGLWLEGGGMITLLGCLTQEDPR